MSQAKANAEHSCLGPELHCHGDLSGTGDLVVEGRLDGSIHLDANVTVRASARLEADISARWIHVEGRVCGNLVATEKIVLHQGCQVVGTVAAPRLVIEEGAQLSGEVHMQKAVADAATSQARPRSVAKDTQRVAKAS